MGNTEGFILTVSKPRSKEVNSLFIFHMTAWEKKERFYNTVTGLGNTEGIIKYNVASLE